MVKTFIWENKIFLTEILDTFLSSECMFIYLESQLREEEIYFIPCSSNYSNFSLILSYKKYLCTQILTCLFRKKIYI